LAEAGPHHHGELGLVFGFNALGEHEGATAFGVRVDRGDDVGDFDAGVGLDQT